MMKLVRTCYQPSLIICLILFSCFACKQRRVSSLNQTRITPYANRAPLGHVYDSEGTLLTVVNNADGSSCTYSSDIELFQKRNAREVSYGKWQLHNAYLGSVDYNRADPQRKLTCQWRRTKKVSQKQYQSKGRGDLEDCQQGQRWVVQLLDFHWYPETVRSSTVRHFTETKRNSTVLLWGEDTGERAENLCFQYQLSPKK